MNDDTNDKKSSDEIRDRLKRAGLMDHLAKTDEQTNRLKRDAKILPFKPVPKHDRTAAPDLSSLMKRRLAGGLYIFLITLLVYTSMR